MSTTHASAPVTGTGNTPRGRTPFWVAAMVIARREISTRLASKGFTVPTLIVFAVILLAAVLGPRLGDVFTSTTEVAVTSQTQAAIVELGEGYEPILYNSTEAAQTAVENGEVDVAVVPSTQPGLEYNMIAERDVSTTLTQLLSVTPEVTLLDPNAPNPMILYFIGLGFGVVFFMSAITFGTTIAQSVVEEKQTRIVEILLAAIPARAILAGKVLGTTFLAVAQVGLYAVAALLGMAINGDQLHLDGLGLPILWFVVLFTVAFVMIAALYGAAAALVSRQEDIGSVSSPIMMLIMIPYFAIIMFSNNETVLTIMSYIPFSAPVAVPVRIYQGFDQLWENLLSLGILVASAVIAIQIASTIYERSVLKMGQAVKWRDALKA